MKWMIASDIHGSAHYCKMMLEQYQKEGAQRLLLLGDILYHGPRNDLPKEYAPKEVLSMLNAHKKEIFCVRGNCDAEVDQMVLQFPILADYALLAVGKRALYATHGHLFSQENLPPLQEGDILLNGHTHVPKCTVHESYLYMNPGSISLPKENSYHGYMTMEDGLFLWKDLQGEIKNRFQVEP